MKTSHLSSDKSRKLQEEGKNRPPSTSHPPIAGQTKLLRKRDQPKMSEDRQE